MTGTVIPVWTLGDRLRKAREVAGISTATDMASRLGVTERTIRNWEQGATRPKLQTLVAWSSITGVSLDWLEDREPTTSAISAGYPTPWLVSPPRLRLVA